MRGEVIIVDLPMHQPCLLHTDTIGDGDAQQNPIIGFLGLQSTLQLGIFAVALDNGGYGELIHGRRLAILRQLRGNQLLDRATTDQL